MMLTHLMGKLKNHILLTPKSNSLQSDPVVEIVETPRANKEVVPNDVKEGYFAVLSVNAQEKRYFAVLSVNAQEKPKRFIVKLHLLTNPSFLKLLKQTEDEYGFGQKGVLEVPCLAAELQKILTIKIGRNTASNFAF